LRKISLNDLFQVFRGIKTIVGIKKTKKNFNYKLGLFSLAELNSSSNEEEIIEMNKYYINNYSLTLDFDIFVKSFFNKER